MSVKITELGCAGHLIMSSRCRWRRHTQIGDVYRVSTVGDYFPSDTREPIGWGDQFFESMVFATAAAYEPNNDGCGCRQVVDWTGLEIRRYATAGEAQAGHEDLVAKYATLAEVEQ